MRYFLTVDSISAGPQIEIDQERYESCTQAKTILAECLDIEENYEILVANYLELEKQILDITITSMVREHIGYSDFFDVRLALNIRLVNLLTSARLYCDQLFHCTKVSLSHLGGPKEVIKPMCAREYGENPMYRFMEELRNHVQHRGLPVHWTSTSGRWTSLGEDGLLEYSMDLGVQRKLLEEAGKFKKNVLREMPDKVDLKTASRSYVESLSKVHLEVRALIQDRVRKSRLTIEEARDEYGKVYKENVLGLCIQVTDGASITETVPLFLAWDDIRLKLQKRNQSLANLKKRYATGKANSS